MNLLRDTPFLVRKPNRPSPEGTIRPFVVAAMALLMALTGFAPVAASDAGTTEIRGFVSSRGTAIVVGELQMESRTSARAAVRAMDARAIEDSMGVLVIEQQPLSRDLTRTFDIDAGTISAGLLDGDPFLLVIFAKGDTVAIAMMLGDDLDGEMFASWTVELFLDGAADVSAPFGYVELDLDDGDTASDDSPFEGLIEGRI